MNSYYPEFKQGDFIPSYYVEFNRGDRPNEFTLFKRNFMYSKEELAKKDSPFLKMCNEVHPWNLFTAEFEPDGCKPDRAWVCWMVDALNGKIDVDPIAPHEHPKKY